MTFRTRALALGAVALIAAGALAGCTAPQEPDPTPTPTSTDATDPGVTDITDAPGTGENLVGALADATTDSCELDGDAWVATGSVTNPTDGNVNYRIYVSLLNGENDTRGLQQVNVDAVGAGASADWESRIEITDEDLTCVLRVERYAVG
jgi:hypothetical protein